MTNRLTANKRNIAFLFLTALLTQGSLSLALADGGSDIGTAKHSVSDLQRREIRFQRYTNPKWSVIEVKRTIRTAVKRWPVPGGVSTAIAVARCESGLRYDAYNPNGHGGIYQQDTGYWAGRQNAWGRPRHRWHLAESWRNARSNIIVSIRMAHASGWGGWSCA